jgi:prepilin-type N-terminal cleavage/methylation domain-containing protein
MRPNDVHVRVDGRTGVTLVELVVALALFGLVATLMLTVLRGQQRFHVGALEIIDTKRSAHQAVELLYGQLRAASNADIYTISDSSIAFRATLGSAHICAIDSARSVITHPPPAPTAERGLSSFLTIPRAGDSLLILDLGDTPGAEDDGWHAHIISSDPHGGVCPLRPHGLAANAGEMAGVAVAMTPPLGASTYVGAPVRFFRPARYSLYRSGAGDWMLGYSTCAAGSCSVRQPLSGPYLPFASHGPAGVAFQYADAQGAPTSDPLRVARIDVVARARSASALDVAHIRKQRYQDSLSISIALRNRS